MYIQFHCPKCEAEVSALKKLSGEWLDCPNCGSAIMVPIAPVGPDTILGGFRIIKKIGSGGMGDVYLAEQKSMHRQVALKTVPPALTRDDNFLELFRNEILQQGSLHHPNIATAFDAGVDRDIHWLAIEYVKGYNLHELIANSGWLPEKAALKIALEVARGMKFAHEKQSMIHRDIKPGNIMVDEDRGVKILDLGLARSLGEFARQSSHSHIVVGTPQYMSPEQADSSSTVDLRSDIYSLGATLYHAVTGQPPYDGNTLVEIITNQVKTQPAPVRSKNPELSARIEHILEKMLATDPNDRYQTWDELIAVIERFLLNPATSDPAPEKVKPKKRPALWGAWGAALLAVALIAGYSLRALTTPQKKATPVHAEPEVKAAPVPVAPEMKAVTEPEPAPSPRITPPTAADKNQSERKALDELYAFATERRLNDPHDLELHRKAFQQIREKAGTAQYSTLELLAGEVIEDVENVIKKQKSSLLASLEKQAEAALAEGLTNECLLVFSSYSGPWEQETAKERNEQITSFSNRIKSMQAKRVRQEKVAREYLSHLSHEYAETVLRRPTTKWEDIVAAHTKTNLLEQVRPFEEYHALTNLTSLLPRAGRLITETFQNDVGAAIEIELSDSSTELLTINAVSNGLIFATRHIEAGEAGLTLTARNLGVHEKARRLSQLEGDGQPLLLGMLAWRMGAVLTATNYFSKIEHPLGQHLITGVKNINQEIRDTAKKASEIRLNEEAAMAMKNMLQGIGMTREEVLSMDAFERPMLKEKNRKLLKQKLKAFDRTFSKTSTAEQEQEVLGQLMNMSNEQGNFPEGDAP